jgi:hypothetical protein
MFAFQFAAGLIHPAINRDILLDWCNNKNFVHIHSNDFEIKKKWYIMEIGVEIDI